MPFRVAAGATVAVAIFAAGLLAQAPSSLTPGGRVLLDAHNAYPYEGRFADRLPRALSTGLPLAIEQDLIWRVGADGRGESVVGHDIDKVAGAPTFEQHFFAQLRPLMERALEEGRRDRWPLVVLNLDFKTDEPEHHAAVLRLLARHRAWLTTASRTASPEAPAPLSAGPLLVLTGSHASQQVDFHDRLAIGDDLLLFGAYEAPPPRGASPEARALALASMPVETLLPQRATNYRRWANFPWHVVEQGGQAHAGSWDAAERTRLERLVAHAHASGLWIRFYTLNGHPAADTEAQGWYKGYNFGSLEAAVARWAAARAAGADFIATDQYEAFAEHRRVAAAR